MYKVKNYEYCVFIGRFSIFHNAHFTILNEALELAEKVIVVIGSANSPRTNRNPWTSKERKKMISSAYSKEDLKRIIFIQQKDYPNNTDKWVSKLQKKIIKSAENSKNIALIG